MVKIKPKRLPYKRIGSLQPLFFPLSTILCPPRPVGAPAIPLPTEVRSAVEEAIETRSALAGFGQTLRIPALPEVQVLAGPDNGRRRRSDAVPRDLRVRQLPAIIRTAIERRGERIVPARVKRPRVILIAEDNPAET